MVTGSYLPIITLNVNGFKAPTKRQLNEYKNKQTNKQIPIFAIYERPTSNEGTHTDWRWGAGKRYSMQRETKRIQGKQYSYQIK